MSPRPESQRIEDILQATDKCYQYESLLSQAETREVAIDAILRNLSIVGEAVNHLSQFTKDKSPEIPWASIVGLRNVLVHQYFGVEEEIIDEVLSTGLAQLKEALSLHRK